MNELKKLGLTEYEIKVYNTLLEYAELNAKEISNKSSVPQTAVYPTVKKLLSKQLIQENGGDPKTFVILPPSNALKSFIEKQFDETKQLTANLIQQAESVQQKKILTEKKQIITVSKGDKFSINQSQKLFTAAKKSCYIYGWRFKLSANKFSGLHLLKDCQKRGVDVKLLICKHPKRNIEILKEYIHAKIPIHETDYENFTMVVIDGEVCKITVRDQENNERTNIEFSHQSFAKSMNQFFLDTWAKSKPPKIVK